MRENVQETLRKKPELPGKHGRLQETVSGCGLTAHALLWPERGSRVSNPMILRQVSQQPPAETPLRHLICGCAASQVHRKQDHMPFKIKRFKENKHLQYEELFYHQYSSLFWWTGSVKLNCRLYKNWKAKKTQ